MKTRIELRQLEKAATVRGQLAEMRVSAMNYRQAIAPDAHRSLEKRVEDGVHALTLAIAYRDMARDMGKWARGES